MRSPSKLLAPLRFRTLPRAPVSDRWGYDRGLPIDRYYIERFLAAHRDDIHGRVLEVKDDAYARRFGRAVETIDVLDVDGTNAAATIIADLTRADAVGDGSFDCFICTQTLQYVYDVGAALRESRRILRPDGVLLATVPAVSRMTVEATGLADFWRFTTASCTELVAREFGDSDATVAADGNLWSCTAFLAGLAVADAPGGALDDCDPRYPLVVTIRAVRR